MANLTEEILGRLGPQGISQIASSLGADEKSITPLIGAALPAILAGMANNTKESTGASSLANALNDHSPSVFDHLGDLLGGGNQVSDGMKILGHVFGDKQPKVEQNLASSSGLNMNLIKQLLPILAPLVMGYLANRKQQDNLDAGGLGDLLGNERKQAESRQPSLGGLAAILDGDGDGSIVDDLLGKVLGRD